MPDSGSYILILRLAEKNLLQVGKLGERSFPAGFYAYVGSAMRGIETRVARHQRKVKPLHWHIDYLLQKALIEKIVRIPGTTKQECAIAAGYARKYAPVRGFGCSDCSCGSHLFFLGPNRP
jgi:sugar fermentation stimulation protein A